jgi:hypothetical protein
MARMAAMMKVLSPISDTQITLKLAAKASQALPDDAA